jgi:amino acid transporter
MNPVLNPSASSGQETDEFGYETSPVRNGLKRNNLRFFRVVAESVGIQGPTGGVVITAAILASIVGGGTALVQVIAAIAMCFVAYAFVLFTRGFNSSGSVYGFTGAVVGPRFGFLSALALMMVYVNFAGGVYASTADEAQPAFATLGIHLSWQVFAIATFALVMIFAYLNIRFSSILVLVFEGVSILFVIIASIIITVKGGYHHHALSLAPFHASGLRGAAIALGVVYAFSVFSGFEGAATLGEESHAPRKIIPKAIMISLIFVALYEIGVAAVIQNAFPSIKALASSPIPLVSITDTYVTPWFGDAINIGAVLSSFGAALACVIAASRMLFALSRDGFGPKALQRTGRTSGAPIGALAAVGGVSFLMLLGFLWEKVANTAVADILTYGADLIIVAYILAVIAALVFTIRSHAAIYQRMILLVGLVILGYVVKETFLPLPAGAYRWDAVAAAATLLLGIALPRVFPQLRSGITESKLLGAGTRELLGPSSSRSSALESSTTSLPGH